VARREALYVIFDVADNVAEILKRHGSSTTGVPIYKRFETVQELYALSRAAHRALELYRLEAEPEP
jgi:hypothetical protein